MNVSDKIKILPGLPGVYRFLDSEGRIIYIGKAKNLKKRVSQYFADPNKLSIKTRVLVSKIADVMHTVVESEEDAFLLENNLIKEYKPKYNILLKDDKTYPWICIKNEPFPRVFITRRYVKDGSFYYGPYSSVVHAHNIIDLIHTLYPLRTCNSALSKENIENKRLKPCLNYHIKRCAAPCIGNIAEEDYNRQIESIKNLLSGKTGELIKEFKSKMMKASKALMFEQAQLYKDHLELLENHYSKSLIVNPAIKEADVFSIVFENNYAFGNYIGLNNGCITSSLNMSFKMNIEEAKETVLSRFMNEIYSLAPNDERKNHKRASEILVPFLPDHLFLGSNIHVPLKGDKLNLLQLSIKNANAFKFQNMKQEEVKNPDNSFSKAVLSLKESLHLKSMPIHIECFDNSNTQGTNPVASCVVFKNGRPSKRDYRHFNIKTVVGANDFASMKEVIYRRYSRLLRENAPLPQLILVDGGRGQLNCAYEALSELGLENKIELAGIAKRLEEILLPGDPVSNFLDKNSPALKMLMQLRDEAHRFGITHHRSKRSKAQTQSVLREIDGVGEITEQKLLNRYKSVKRIQETPYEDLVLFVGEKIAKAISIKLHKDK